MTKFLGLGRRGWSIVWMAAAPLPLLYFFLVFAVVEYSARSDAAYLHGMVSSYENDAGLQSLRWHPSDTAFTADEMLTGADKPSRCAVAAASIDRFKRLWIDARTYQGNTIHSHAVAAALLSNSEALGARKGCISSEAFNAFLAELRATRDYDLGFHSIGDLAARFPLPGHDGHQPIFFTERSFVEMEWNDLLAPRRLRVLRCEADAHCDLDAMLKQTLSQPQPKAL